MKKLFLGIVSCAALSCNLPNRVKPIEKYLDNKSVVLGMVLNTYQNSPGYNFVELRLKNKDSLYTVYVPEFDVRNLKVGDTLKTK